MASTETMESGYEERTEELRAGAENAKRQMNEAVGKIKRQAADSWDDFTDVVRRHPGKALGITLAAGVAVGLAVAAGSRRRGSSIDRLGAMAGSSIDAWDRIKTGFEDAVCTLRDTVDDAVKKFK